MIYVKSTLIGLMVLFLAAIVYVVGSVAWITRSMHAESGTVGIDVLFFIKSPLFWPSRC